MLFRSFGLAERSSAPLFSSPRAAPQRQRFRKGVVPVFLYQVEEDPNHVTILGRNLIATLLADEVLRDGQSFFKSASVVTFKPSAAISLFNAAT